MQKRYEQEYKIKRNQNHKEVEEMDMKFGFKRNIELRTKYRNKNECLKNCWDIKYKTKKRDSFSELICGEVKFEESMFKLSGHGKNTSGVVFDGKVIEKKGVIFMEGEIQPKLAETIILYGLRLFALYILIQGLTDIYLNRAYIGDLYNSIFLLMVAFLVVYSVPQFIFYFSYKWFIHSLNRKVNV